jgi:hypothetical protein
MATKNLSEPLEIRLKSLADTTDEPRVHDAIKVLGDAISTGDIRNATGIAIGRNIRLVVQELKLPAESVAELLEVRNTLRASMVLDLKRYRLDTILSDKTYNFVGRSFVFLAIDEFFVRQPKGYFTIEADPGMGKSAIMAEYVRRTGCISHFNIRTLGVNTVVQFLENVCSQIIVDFGLPYASLPADATRDGAFLLTLLQQASAQLLPDERLVIAVDALDEVNLSNHPEGANILYLPSSLPDSVYFILSRRDVSVPLVVQTPQDSLDLVQHPAENREDIEAYLRYNTKRVKLREWINRQEGLRVEDFVNRLADLSENNFMYLRYVLPEIESGSYQGLDIQKLPTGLTGYYEDHWERMGMKDRPLPRTKIRIIYIMCEVGRPVSRKLISDFSSDEAVQVDELAVQEVLDEWSQFLHEEPSPEGKRYSLYHSSFRDFLHRKDIVQAAGVTIKGINALIGDTLYGELFGEEGQSLA